MSRRALEDYVHPILGVFERSQVINHLNELFVDFQKKGSTSIAGLGYEFHDFSIFLKGATEPPDDMVADLVRLVNWPSSRNHEIEARLFQYYEENRDRYVEVWDDNGYSAEEIAKLVPTIKEPVEVWKLIERPRYISGGTWPEVSIAFDSKYDEEHELHISFANDKVSEVWDE